MFDAGPDGFEGEVHARKHIGLTRASKATATRDLQELVRMGAMVTEGQPGMCWGKCEHPHDLLILLPQSIVARDWFSEGRLNTYMPVI
jgi:hypothetical protein